MNLMLQDVRLLFHKCALLYSQGRKEEFVNIGLDMIDWYFIDVASYPDLYGKVRWANPKILKGKREYSEYQSPKSLNILFLKNTILLHS